MCIRDSAYDAPPCRTVGAGETVETPVFYSNFGGAKADVYKRQRQRRAQAANRLRLRLVLLLEALPVLRAAGRAAAGLLVGALGRWIVRQGGGLGPGGGLLLLQGLDALLGGGPAAGGGAQDLLRLAQGAPRREEPLPRAGMRGADAGIRVRAAAAVSYTHLDVYKRQAVQLKHAAAARGLVQAVDVLRHHARELSRCV